VRAAIYPAIGVAGLATSRQPDIHRPERHSVAGSRP
jgi:hypothetical protein